VLRGVTIALVVAALARPQMVLRETWRESDGLDILLAIDTSGSMEAPDMGTGGASVTRLEAGKRVMVEFVEGREGDRIGLLLFGQEAFIQVPLTHDHVALADFIREIDIGAAGKRATAVGDAIAVATKRMKDLEAPSKLVVLVTDGRSNAGQVSALQAAEAAAALGVKVYTIGIGGAGTASRGLLTAWMGGQGADIDEPMMRRVAAITGAKYWRATDASTLREVYANIDLLETSPAKSKEFVHRDELFRDFLLPAIGLWLAELLLGLGPLRRLP
jgi:Ca-activated chloride channel family protein